MILAIWERWKNRTVSFRFYVVVFLAFGFVAASFQTWRQEHYERIKAEQTLKPRERDPAVVEQLQKFYSEAATFNRRVLVALQGPDEEFNRIDGEFLVWTNGVDAWIKSNMAPAALDRVGQISPSSQQYVGVSQQRNALAYGTMMIRDNLKALIENPAWDKR